MNTQIIIDTDPGVDDALAILMAVAAGMPIAGITTTYGNASIEDVTRNALTILELLKTQIPVYKGASSPLVGEPYFATVHGENGLGGYEKKLKTKEEKITVEEFLLDPRVHPMKDAPRMTLLCLGPTTNIARTSRKNPEFVKNIDSLIILGGVIGQKGNVTPYAEFNVYNDPLALKETLALPCRKILIPIDVCRKVMFTKKDFDGITNPSLRTAIQAITELYISFYLSNTNHGGFTGGVMYDLLVPMYVLHPELFTTKTAYVVVEAEKNERYGETTVVTDKDPNCILVTDVNAEGLKSIFFEVVNGWKESESSQ